MKKSRQKLGESIARQNGRWWQLGGWPASQENGNLKVQRSLVLSMMDVRQC